MTEEQATKGAKLDIGGMLISWDLRNSNLRVLPECFKQLRLTKLVLGDTPLDGAEETYKVLSQIPTLTELDLSFSEITTLAEGISGCTALKTLILCNCTSLRSLGDGVGDCTTLQTLDCRHCYKLESLPPSLGGCTALQTLDLRGCRSLTTLGDGLVQQLESQGCTTYGIPSSSSVRQEHDALPPSGSACSIS